MKIFYDHTGLRWKKVKKITEITIGLFMFLTTFFVFSLIAMKITNDSTNLLQASLGLAPATEVSLDDLHAAAEEKFSKLVENRIATAADVNGDEYQSQVMAFIGNGGDYHEEAKLREHMHDIDVLLPLWLDIDPDLNIKYLDPENITYLTNLVNDEHPDVHIMPVIRNSDPATGDFSEINIKKLLNDDTAQNRFINELGNIAQSRNWYGVSFDIHNIAADDLLKYQRFINEIGKVFGERDLAVSVNLPISNNGLDYAVLAEYADFLIIRAFDEHWMTSEEGPVASQEWFEERIIQITDTVPNNKLVISIGTFGYDWIGGSQQAKMISFSQAMLLAKESGNQIGFRFPILNTTFEYVDKSNSKHKVYLLDAVTAFNQMKFSSKFEPKGFALWSIGWEDDTIWSLFNKENTLDLLVDLETIPAFQRIDYFGTGDIIQVQATPNDGKRELVYDDRLGLITKVDYKTVPSGYTIALVGGENINAVSLTFDDGPDPYYTGRILDILRKNGVKATFFVLGENVEKDNDTLRRIVDEGHLVGNHTYFHTDISELPAGQAAMEFNATQLSIGGAANIETLLFRPPYVKDIKPQLLENIKTLKAAQDAGYITIDNSIDPKDWELPGVDEMVQAVVDQAKENHGGVILLHDGGGDRTQTIEALPKIIAALKENGFQIVPLNEMMGVATEDVNPKLHITDSANIFLNSIYLKFVSFVLYLLKIFIIFGLIVGIIRFFPIVIMALLQVRRAKAKTFKKNYYPFVSVIIAAYNEEKVILETIDNILQSDYPKNRLEIIIVNDGSTDNTWKVLYKNYADHSIVKVFNKENGGKSSAINYGISQAKGKIMFSQDADTLIAPYTINKLIRHFSDPEIGAVAGNAKVGNRHNLLTKFQALEYITSQNLDKRAFDVLNAITVVPGAIGAWRLDIIRQLGGLDDSTLAEDSDLTLRIIQEGYRVHFEAEGIAYTEAPDNFKSLASQRFRWAFGTLQVLKKNKKIIANPEYKWLGMVGVPNIIFFQIFSPLITPIVDLALLLQVILSFIALSHDFHLISVLELAGLFFYFALFTVIDLISSLVAFSLERKENWKLILWFIPQRFFYRFFINWICIKSLYYAIKGCPVGWGKLERTGVLKSSTVEQAVYRS